MKVVHSQGLEGLSSQAYYPAERQVVSVPLANWPCHEEVGDFQGALPYDSLPVPSSSSLSSVVAVAAGVTAVELVVAEADEDASVDQELVGHLAPDEVQPFPAVALSFPAVVQAFLAAARTLPVVALAFPVAAQGFQVVALSFLAVARAFPVVACQVVVLQFPVVARTLSAASFLVVAQTLFVVVFQTVALALSVVALMIVGL